MGDDEWTFVPPKNRSKSSSNKNNKKRERHLAKAKQLLNTIHAKESDDNDQARDHISDEKELEMTIHLVEKCMRDLENFNAQASHQNPIFCISGLVESIQEAAKMNEEDSTDEKSCIQRYIDEIVCYGIGTFYKASGENMHSHSLKRYNPPLIQLACVLLLRGAFADVKFTISEGMHISKDDSTSRHPHNITYEEQQNLVPMVYFEPFIHAMERKVLAHFHVKVLDINEQGKRRISTQRHTEINEPSLPPSQKSSTLFYMPHCPMRLYSNVLWANWNIQDEEDVLMDGRIVIMGNSFQAYDDRIMSSEQKNDKTNAIFPLLPYTRETKVIRAVSKQGAGTKKKKILSGSSMVNDALSLQEVELAFNDCAVISFSQMVGTSGEKVQEERTFPKRPLEYFVSNDDGHSEVI